MDTEKPKPLRGKALQLAKQMAQDERTYKIMAALEKAKANRKTLPNGMSVPPLPIEDLSIVAGSESGLIKSIAALKASREKQKREAEERVNIDEFDELAPKGKLTPHQMNLLAAREANRRFAEASEAFVDTPFVEVDFDKPENTKFPSYVGSVARKVFLDVMQMYKTNGIENLLDTSTVLLYATTVEKFHIYESKFAAGVYEYTMTNPMSGLRSESPESKIHNATISSMKTLCSLLLMNPKSRGSQVQQKKQMSALEGFLASRNKK